MHAKLSYAVIVTVIVALAGCAPSKPIAPTPLSSITPVQLIEEMAQSLARLDCPMFSEYSSVSIEVSIKSLFTNDGILRPDIFERMRLRVKDLTNDAVSLRLEDRLTIHLFSPNDVDIVAEKGAQSRKFLLSPRGASACSMTDEEASKIRGCPLGSERTMDTEWMMMKRLMEQPMPIPFRK